MTHRVATRRAGRRCVDLVPAEPRVFPVGRLDCDTEGLLLLTNDGDLTQLLTHPSHGVEKEYLAEVDGVPTPAALRALREGVELDDGPTAPARVALVQRAATSTRALEIVIHEGRNRQVRRMCEAVGHPVRAARAHAHRPARATGTLAPGEWRALTPRRGAGAATRRRRRDSPTSRRAAAEGPGLTSAR